MKLNQKICKKCFKTEKMGWIKNDEKRWNDDNAVICIRLKGGILADINKPPHNNCKYKLEHIILNQKIK